MERTPLASTFPDMGGGEAPPEHSTWNGPLRPLFCTWGKRLVEALKETEGLQRRGGLAEGRRRGRGGGPAKGLAGAEAKSGERLRKKRM